MTTGFPVPLESLADAPSVLCPDHLCRDLRSALPGREVLPFCAAGAVPVAGVDAVVLHKPGMHRLDFGALAEVVSRFAPVYADGAFVVYRRGRGGAAAELPPEMAVHLGIVEHHLRDAPLPALGEPRRRRALVVSAHGAGNVGDDAVSLAAAGVARAAGFEAVDLSGPGWTAQQLDAADLVVVGGGGLLYDTNHLGEAEEENVGTYTAPILRARLLGKAAAGLGLGTQGILTPTGRRAFGRALRAADLLTVRDAGDAAELREGAGVDGARLTADLAFALRALERPEPPPPAGGPGERPLALVALPSTAERAFRGGADGLAAYGAAILRELANTHEVLLARHSTDDAALCDRLRRATGVRVAALDRIGVRASLALYRSASLVVSGRYHGVVFAALREGVRVVPLGGAPTKLGRLVQRDLPSLADAWAEPSALERTPVADLLARAAVPAPAEVRRLEARALENIGLLDSALAARGAAFSPRA